MNLVDIKFYMCTDIFVLCNLVTVIKQCRYATSPSQYLELLQHEYPPTPIGEELCWWLRTLRGEVVFK